MYKRISLQSQNKGEEISQKHEVYGRVADLKQRAKIFKNNGPFV